MGKFTYEIPQNLLLTNILQKFHGIICRLRISRPLDFHPTKHRPPHAAHRVLSNAAQKALTVGLVLCLRAYADKESTIALIVVVYSSFWSCARIISYPTVDFTRTGPSNGSRLKWKINLSEKRSPQFPICYTSKRLRIEHVHRNG